MATLHAKLLFAIVTGNEDLPLLGNHHSAIFATANLLHNQLFTVDASYYGCCRLVSWGSMTQTSSAVLARAPQIHIASICNKGTV